MSDYFETYPYYSTIAEDGSVEIGIELDNSFSETDDTKSHLSYRNGRIEFYHRYISGDDVCYGGSSDETVIEIHLDPEQTDRFCLSLGQDVLEQSRKLFGQRYKNNPAIFLTYLKEHGIGCYYEKNTHDSRILRPDYNDWPKLSR